jgi:GAF domain-containing protein
VEIKEICDKLEALLSARSGEEKVTVSVDALSRIFGVSSGEVAIFALDASGESLNFLWPKEMRSSGSIPISASRSLVTNTAQQKRSFLNNNFASTPHLFVFEGFAKDKSAPIQRIMSVPMLNGEELKGVIQVSRKGLSDAAVKSFSEPELKALGEIAKVIGRHL